MEEESGASASASAWSWVLEALSMSDLVDLRLLYGLIELVPQLQLLRDAREATAFRCLQALSASASASPTTKPANVSQLHFPPSLPSQHVIRHVSHQTDHLQKDSSQELKSSIHTFVDLKKPTLPTSTLELLKNMILQGDHLFLEDLRHHSGLNIPSNSNSAAPISPRHSNSVISLHPTQHLNTSSPTPQINHHLPDVNISKSDTDGCSIHNHVQGTDTASHEFDHFAPLGKRIKVQNQCSMYSKPQHSVSSDDIQQDSDHPLDKANQTCGGDSSQKTVAGDSKTSTENYYLPRISPDNSGSRRQHDRTGVTMSKGIFSSSQSVFNEDTITLTDTEANLCMKCNEGGQLLSCCSNTCPLFFHESCLGCFVSVDDQGNFYCPICAYSSAVSDFVKAKEKMSLTRKQLALFIGGDSSNQPKRDHSRSLDNAMDQQRHEHLENAADALQNGAPTAQVAKSH